MDKSIVVVDESRWRGDFVTSAMKPSGSVAGINLVAVDLGFAMEEINSPVHEHFSIRGFVAGMRKKDPKACLPFALEEDDLPPLDIPSFRWWKCSNCIRDVCVGKKLLTGKNYHGEHGSKEIVNGEENKNNQMIIYNPSCNEEETGGRNSNGGSTHVDVAEAYQHNNDAGVAEKSNTQANEPENVSSECDDQLLSKRKPKLVSLNRYSSFERSSNDQTSCKYRGIPDLNEPFIETPSSSPEKKLLTPTECRSLALLRFSDACKQIARESKRQMGLQKAPNNIESCKIGTGKKILNTNIDDNVASKVCTLNRDPADFSSPDETNEFTISGKDLKPRKIMQKIANENL